MKKTCVLLLLAVFAVANLTTANAAFDVFTATMVGQADFDYREDASVGFSINHESIIFMLFDEPVTLSGDIGIRTNIPVISNADAASTGAFIHSLVIDGVELGAAEVPLVNDGGYLRFDIVRGSDDVYNFAEKRPFSRMELTFVVINMPEGLEEPEDIDIIDIVPIIETIEIEAPAPTPPPTDESSGTSLVWLVLGGAILLVVVIGVVISKKKG
ncbi:MAG: hypothetical protein FWF78_00165 [Defluviitaleaceae bacterium]|nr:hypothetical protein [Defluviitaleaceae bacterium]